MSTLMIKVSIEGCITGMLVNTCSAVTLVREEVWMEAKSGGACQFESPVHIVVAENGGKLNITGQYTLQIAVGPLSNDHVVSVAKNLHQECLLGADFFMCDGCVLDLQNKIMFTVQGHVHFVSSVCIEHNILVCFVALSEKTARCVCQKRRQDVKSAAGSHVKSLCTHLVCLLLILSQMTSSLAQGVHDRMAALLRKYQDVIALNDNDLGCTQLLGHHIDISDALPVRQPARRLPFHQQGEVCWLIDDMHMLWAMGIAYRISEEERR